MKTIIKQLLTVIILIPLLAKSNVQSKKDTIISFECLWVKGLAIDENNIAIDGVEVSLFKHNKKIEQIEITNRKNQYNNFMFVLEANQYYTVEVSKPGYVKRSVVFYTELSSDMNIKSLFKFEFEIVLFKEKKMDDDYLDFPIALVRYNKKNKNFEHNISYTKFIKTKIQESENAANIEYNSVLLLQCNNKLLSVFQ